MISRKIFLLSAASLAVMSTAAPALAGPELHAAVLPSSRSTTINTSATIFASMINAGDSAARACDISLRNSALPLSVSYQAMQADNATPAANQDTPVDIEAGASQAFIVSFTANAPMPAGSVRLSYSCADDAGVNFEAPVIDGVNALSFSASATPAPDILTIAQSPSGDGYIRIPSVGGAEAMAISAVNIGAGTNGNAEDADLIAMPDTGGVALPISLFVCETDALGTCQDTPSTFVHTSLGSTPKTYTVFANADPEAGIPDFPDISRVYLRFYEESTPQSDKRGDGRGATGLAVTAPAPAASQSAAALPEGIWEARFTGSNGGYNEGLLFITAAGALSAIVYGESNSDGDHNGNGDQNDHNGNGDHNDGNGNGDQNGDNGNGDHNDGNGNGDQNGDNGNGDHNDGNGNGDHNDGNGNGDHNDGNDNGDQNGDNDNDGDHDNGNGNSDNDNDSNDQPDRTSDAGQNSAFATLMSGSVSTDGAGGWSASAQVLDLGGSANSVEYQLGGSWSDHDSISGTYLPVTGASASSIGNGSLRAAFSRDYDRVTTVSNLAGSFDFYDGNTDIGNLVVSSNGDFSGTYSVPGVADTCTVSGGFSSASSGSNLYTVSISLQNCGGAGSYTGAATLRDENDDSSNQVNPIIGMAMTPDSNSGLILDLFPQGHRPENN